MLYSALWSIFWNLVSMKIVSKKKIIFLISSIFFSLSIFFIAYFISNYLLVSILAFLAGLFFWIIYNLIESNFFKNIAIDNKKSYWWASLWIIVATVVAWMMFFIDFFEKYFWFINAYIFMSLIILLIWILVFLKKDIYE